MKPLEYLVIAGAVIQLVGVIPYIWEMLRGNVRPNRITWLIWAILSFIAGAASLASGVRWAVLPTFVSGLGPFSIFLISFRNKNSYWQLGLFDYACGLLSLLAIALWWITSVPDFAIALSIIGDFLAGLPTLLKSIKYPETENAWPFIAGIIGPLTGLAVIKAWTFSAYAFPVYLIVISAFMSVLIGRKKYSDALTDAA